MTGFLDSIGPALLFCPGDRPERFDKAASVADLAVLDLEDGVGAARKDLARADVAAYLLTGGATRAAVRINSPATERGMTDATAMAQAGAQLLLLPKIEAADELDRVARATGCELIAMVESARGILMIDAIAAHPAVVAISWGLYDLSVDLGLRTLRTEAGELLPPLAHARDRLLIAAAAARIHPLDTVTAELSDPGIVARDAANGAVLGFRGKLAIHPAQVAVIRDAFRPSPHEMERSARLLAAGEGRGAFVFEGEMVDEPILRRARRILAASRHT